MLTYLILVTEGLVSAAITLTMLYCCITRDGRRLDRIIVLAGYGVGLIAGAVMSYCKNHYKSINTGMWNMYTYLAAAGLLVVLAVLSVPPLKKRMGRVGAVIRDCNAALLGASVLFYVLPDVIAYPFTFDTADSSVLSTDFLFRFIGYLLGLVLMLLIVVSITRIAKQISPKLMTGLTFAALGINGLYQVMLAVRALRRSRIAFYDSDVIRDLLNASYNNRDLFVYAIIVCAAIMPIAVWVKSFNVKEPYTNPAQHRKIRAKWRTMRRWSSAVIVCVLLSVMNMTVVEALNTKTVTITPPEESQIIGDSVYVSLDQVSDGHLHRFQYDTESGVGIRFIVIKKPNSQNYGVGLDACDICGQTGYYERDGQVVCKLCDVVMNINTIGFKGGCNPIVINYRVDSGFIIVPISELVAHEKEFK